MPFDNPMLIKILIGAGILFVIGFIGNMISFSSRFVNALVTAIVFAIIYGALYYAVDQAVVSEQIGPTSFADWMKIVGVAAVLVFVIDLIANMLSFNSRFMNALMTAIVFAVLFAAIVYASGMGYLPAPPTTQG